MKVYIVQCNEKVSSEGYSSLDNAQNFINHRAKEAIESGYDLMSFNSGWKLCYEDNRGVQYEYKILEIEIK